MPKHTSIQTYDMSWHDAETPGNLDKNSSPSPTLPACKKTVQGFMLLLSGGLHLPTAGRGSSLVFLHGCVIWHGTMPRGWCQATGVLWLQAIAYPMSAKKISVMIPFTQGSHNEYTTVWLHNYWKMVMVQLWKHLGGIDVQFTFVKFHLPWPIGLRTWSHSESYEASFHSSWPCVAVMMP